MISEQRAAVAQAIEALSDQPGNEELLKPLLERNEQLRKEEGESLGLEEIAGEIQTDLANQMIEAVSVQMASQAVFLIQRFLGTNQLSLVDSRNKAATSTKTPLAGALSPELLAYLRYELNPNSQVADAMGPLLFVPAKPASNRFRFS